MSTPESAPARDVINRDTHVLTLAKRLLRLEVRTQMIMKLTGLPRNRLAALRRRLNVPSATRPRGHTHWRAQSFVATAERRFETASLAALLMLCDLVGPEGSPAARRLDRLDVGERLCEIYEYVRACFPDIEIDLERLLLLHTSLVRREHLEVGRCLCCGCPIVLERDDRRHRICTVCESGEEGMAAASASGSGPPPGSRA